MVNSQIAKKVSKKSGINVALFYISVIDKKYQGTYNVYIIQG